MIERAGEWSSRPTGHWFATRYAQNEPRRRYTVERRGAAEANHDHGSSQLSATATNLTAIVEERC